MKKICTGPLEFAPYRPWSIERRYAARERARGGPYWVGERPSIAERMWAEGATFKAIAEYLGGISRSAVAGYIRRKGLLRSSKIERPAAPITVAPTPLLPPPRVSFISYDPMRLLPPAHKPGVRPRELAWTRDYLKKIGDGRHGMRIGGAWHLSNAGVKFDFLCTCDCGVTYGMEARQMMEDRTGTISCQECATILASRDTRTTLAVIGGY